MLLSSLVTVGFTYYMLESKTEKIANNKLSLSSVVLILFVFCVPALFIWILKKHFTELETPEIKDKYGSLYLGVKTGRMVTVL